MSPVVFFRFADSELLLLTAVALPLALALPALPWPIAAVSPGNGSRFLLALNHLEQ